MQSPPSQSDPVKKQEDDDKAEKRDVKPLPKTLNRVPRACNACRKQKMRCEGADNPPCRRCRNTGLECLFEKPSREATLTGEAGLERIRSLENHVAEIGRTQTVISEKLSEILQHVRGGGFVSARSPSAFPPYPSPSLKSPHLSASTPSTATQHTSPPGGTTPFTSIHSHSVGLPPKHRNSFSGTGYQGSSSSHSMSQDEGHSAALAPMYGNYPHGGQSYNMPQGPTLPPFSSIQTMAPLPQPNNTLPSVRYQPGNQNFSKLPNKYAATATKRQASSNVASADSSDIDEEENGELPASGLVAPWEVLRGLADVAIERATKNGDSSEPHSRTRTPSPERQLRPSKKRKIRHSLSQPLTFQDVVTKGIISETEARELFTLFYHGCSTFLPVFDSATDTYDALHERSPFAVNAICMVAARVRDGGSTKPSEVHQKCLDEVRTISQATLFAPVLHCEAVQAMILVSGWSDNGWLSGGHAVRMAMELSMHKAWPKLYKRMQQHKIDIEEDKSLVIMSRTWFCLYLFEHQLSYGTGRPAVLKDDESIKHCRWLLNHPLTIEDDMRLVSTVELISIRERVHNELAPYEGPIPPSHFDKLHKADRDFKEWYHSWDALFSRKYENAAFYRQSLQIQHFHAELFHNATALRGINGPEDVEKMPASQRELARRSIGIAREGLDITVNSASYREGMKYAVHYTHATATFAASFLLRLARLFPDEVDTSGVRDQVDRLVTLLGDIPAKRYALTLQLMLKRSKRRVPRSPNVSREPQRPLAIDQSPTNHSATAPPQRYGRAPDSYFTYETAYPSQDIQMHGPQSSHGTHIMQTAVNPAAQQYMAHVWHGNFTEADQMLRVMDPTEVPVWISDQSLGGQSFTQHGLDAFIIPPPDYATQIL